MVENPNAEDELKKILFNHHSDQNEKSKMIDDEYLNYYFIFKYIIVYNEEMTKFVCENYSYEKLNPHFKNSVLTLIFKYANKYWSKDRLDNEYDLARSDFIKNYSSFSNFYKNRTKGIFIQMENLSDNLILNYIKEEAKFSRYSISLSQYLSNSLNFLRIFEMKKNIDKNSLEIIYLRIIDRLNTISSKLKKNFESLESAFFNYSENNLNESKELDINIQNLISRIEKILNF
jgi:hypothetical protein